jgi:hypothetical protein
MANIERKERRMRRTAIKNLHQENLAYELVAGKLLNNNSYDTATAAGQFSFFRMVVLNFQDQWVHRL